MKKIIIARKGTEEVAKSPLKEDGRRGAQAATRSCHEASNGHCEGAVRCALFPASNGVHFTDSNEVKHGIADDRENHNNRARFN